MTRRYEMKTSIDSTGSAGYGRQARSSGSPLRHRPALRSQRTRRRGGWRPISALARWTSTGPPASNPNKQTSSRIMRTGWTAPARRSGGISWTRAYGRIGIPMRRAWVCWMARTLWHRTCAGAGRRSVSPSRAACRNSCRIGVSRRHGRAGVGPGAAAFRKADEGRMHRGHEMWLATLKWVAEGR